MKWIHSLAAGIVLVLAAPPAFAEDISLEQLPPPVRETLQREVSQQAQLGDVERDHDRGRTIYEIEFSEDGRRFEIDIGEDGRVLNRHAD